MLDNFETILWYYKKSSTYAFLTDMFLLIFSAAIFVKIHFGQSPPLKIKDIIDSNSLILWIKTVAIILSDLAVSLFTQQVYLIFPFFNFSFSIKYFVSKIYGTLTFYILGYLS